MDAIKKLLGEDLFSKVAEKLGDSKLALISKGMKALIHKEDEEPVITNNGEWIPKEKFNNKLDEIKQLKKELGEVQTKLTDLSTTAQDAKTWKEKVEALTAELNTNKTEAVKRETNITKKFALMEALRTSGAKYPELLSAKFNLDELELDGEKIKGFEDKLKPLKESFKDLFGEVSFKSGKGSGNGEPNIDVKLPDGFITHEQFSKMSQKERVANIDKINESSVHWEQNKN